jgi:hypothetical protein
MALRGSGRHSFTLRSVGGGIVEIDAIGILDLRP